MSQLLFKDVNKVYPNGYHAVHDFNMEIKNGEFICLVGDSGCGKSTTLRMIAGLEDITSGEFYIDGKLANQMSSRDRGIAMVFQSYALYPHLTVYENLAFGLMLEGIDADVIEEKVQATAKILGLTDYLERFPRALSGGQCQRVAVGRALIRQRVALGRSIVRRPKVFLMDEPLSNLDAKLRVAMRSEIVRIHEEVGATTIYVTHDQTEAMTMSDRIVVMKSGGYVQQIGTPFEQIGEPDELYRNPANMFVAGFIGTPAMNFLHGTLENGYFIIDGTGEKIKLTPDQKKLLKNYEGKRLVYGIRPENIVYEKSERFEKFKDTAFKMKAGMIELLGDIINVHGDVGGNRVILKMNSKYAVKERDEFTAAIDTEYSRFFNESTTKAITPDHCDYEEAELTASLDEDNVTIIEQEKQGIFAKALGAVKNKIKSAKTAKSPADTAAPADQADTAARADNNREN